MPAMKTTLTAETTTAIARASRPANVAFAKRYPGESAARQPVHTVYGGAHIFKADGRGEARARSRRSRSSSSRRIS